MAMEQPTTSRRAMLAFSLGISAAIVAPAVAASPVSGVSRQAWEAAKAHYEEVDANHEQLFAKLDVLPGDSNYDAYLKAGEAHIAVWRAAADRCCAVPAPDLEALLFKMEGPMSDCEERLALCISDLKRLLGKAN